MDMMIAWMSANARGTPAARVRRSLLMVALSRFGYDRWEIKEVSQLDTDIEVKGCIPECHADLSSSEVCSLPSPVSRHYRSRLAARQDDASETTAGLCVDVVVHRHRSSDDEGGEQSL